MPAVQRSEFTLALNQVANERGVDPTVVLETVKNAILAAYRKDNPGIEVEEYSTSLDPRTGEAKIFHKEKDVTPPGFGRIAAQTAKQVILQKIREKEKEAIMTDYRVRVGTIVNGHILRFAGPNIIVDIGKTEAIMPAQEQIPNEKYFTNKRMTVYLSEIRQGAKGEEIIVSRASTGLLEGLFKREVPEVSQGNVIIKAIAREPGNRSKVAVYSSQAGIDPVGSCVGQKGVRVQAIIQEFEGLEKIDIIQWQENAKQYIAQALSPAKDVRVEVDEDAKVAHVFISADNLSLAIGREGQNVRLASKLTGYRIEIEEEKGTNETKVSKESQGADEKKETKETKGTKGTKEIEGAKRVVKKKTKKAATAEIQKEDETQKADEGSEEKTAEAKVIEEKEKTNS